MCISLSIYLYVYPSLSLSLSVSLSISQCISLSLSVYLSIYLFPSHFFPLTHTHPTSLSLIHTLSLSLFYLSLFSFRCLQLQHWDPVMKFEDLLEEIRNVSLIYCFFLILYFNLSDYFFIFYSIFRSTDFTFLVINSVYVIRKHLSIINTKFLLNRQ